MAPGSRDDVRGRLQRAAWELYRERGYERTTAAEIAARAGVTERTFFRYFPDKREAAFDGEEAMLAALGAAIAEAPAEVGPMAVLVRAFGAFEPALAANRALSAARQEIIAATPALRERQLAKTAAMVAAIATALQARGVEAKLAALTALTGMAVFEHATHAWFEAPSAGLGVHLERALEDLRGLSGPPV